MNSIKDAKTEKYTSRYTRGFLKMLTNDGKGDTDKFIEQFYTSKNYQGRLEAIKYLISVSGKYAVPNSIYVDALKDFCSQVKVHVLKHFDFQSGNNADIESVLVDIAREDEKLQLRALALEKLAELGSPEHYDLFFSTSLLKSSKESAAGLRGLFKLDREKAYQMAKFRADNSSGNLDLAIAEIFRDNGGIEDLNFFKVRLKARSKFNKIDLIRIYLKMLGKINVEALVKSHILFICEDISLTGSSDLVQLLIMELHHFITDNKDYLEEHDELLRFVNKTVDLLLEKDYMRANMSDPFGPL